MDHKNDPQMLADQVLRAPAIDGYWPAAAKILATALKSESARLALHKDALVRAGIPLPGERGPDGKCIVCGGWGMSTGCYECGTRSMGG